MTHAERLDEALDALGQAAARLAEAGHHREAGLVRSIQVDTENALRAHLQARKGD